MKRDYTIIKNILEKCESSPDAFVCIDAPTDLEKYQLMLLEEAGYICNPDSDDYAIVKGQQQVVQRVVGYDRIEYTIDFSKPSITTLYRLTWKGYDYLDTIRRTQDEISALTNHKEYVRKL